MERGLGRGRRLSQGQSLRSLGPDEPVQCRPSQSSSPVHEPSFASFFSQSTDDVYEVRESATPEGGESGRVGESGRYSGLGEPRNAPLELAAAADDVRRQAAEAQEALLREAREKMMEELEREKQKAREEMERQTNKYNRMVSEVQLREEAAAAKAQELQRKVADAEKRERDAEERDKEAQRKICEAEQRGREADEKAQEAERKAQVAEGKVRKYKESRDAAKEKTKATEVALELYRTRVGKERLEEREELASLHDSLVEEKETSARLRFYITQLKSTCRGFGEAIVDATAPAPWEAEESAKVSGRARQKNSDKRVKESKQSGQGKSGQKGDRDASPAKKKSSGKVSLMEPLPEPDPSTTSGSAPSAHHPSPQPQREDQPASAHDQTMAWCFGETGPGDDEDGYGPADPANLDLNPHLMANRAELGWGQMTAFQKRLVSVLLEGQDLVATGPKDSGMMTTYLVATLHRLVAQHSHGHSQTSPLCLALVSSREVASRMSEDLNTMGDIYELPVFHAQLGEEGELIWARPWAPACHVLVTCPSLLLRAVQKGLVCLDEVSFLALFDVKVLDQDFRHEIFHLLNESGVPPVEARQTAFLFTSTAERPLTREALAAFTEGFLRPVYDILELSPHSDASKAKEAGAGRSEGAATPVARLIRPTPSIRNCLSGGAEERTEGGKGAAKPQPALLPSFFRFSQATASLGLDDWPGPAAASKPKASFP